MSWGKCPDIVYSMHVYQSAIRNWSTRRRRFEPWLYALQRRRSNQSKFSASFQLSGCERSSVTTTTVPPLDACRYRPARPSNSMAGQSVKRHGLFTMKLGQVLTYLGLRLGRETRPFTLASQLPCVAVLVRRGLCAVCTHGMGPVCFRCAWINYGEREKTSMVRLTKSLVRKSDVVCFRSKGVGAPIYWPIRRFLCLVLKSVKCETNSGVSWLQLLSR